MMPSRYGSWCTKCVCVCVCTHVICSLIMNLFIRSATGIFYYVRQIDSTHDVETEHIGYLSATPFRFTVDDWVCMLYVQHCLFFLLSFSWNRSSFDCFFNTFSILFGEKKKHQLFIFYFFFCTKFWFYTQLNGEKMKNKWF